MMAYSIRTHLPLIMGCCHSTDQGFPRGPKPQSHVSKDQRMKDQYIINSRKLQVVPKLHLSQNDLYSKRVTSQLPTCGDAPTSPASSETSSLS